MKCSRVQEKLLLYLAGELSLRESAGLLRHLEKCTGCTVLAETLAETQDLAEAVLSTSVEAPATLDARVMSAVRAEPVRRPAWRAFIPRRRALRRLALAGAALACVLAGFWLGRSGGLRFPGVSPSPPTLDLALLRDVSSGTEPPSIGPVSPEDMSGALTSAVGFRVPVVDLGPEGARLIGGRRAILQGVPVALLRYDLQGKHVALIEVDAAKLASPAQKPVLSGSEHYLVEKRDGVAYVAWHTGKTNCVMVASDVPMHLLFHLACHACEKQERL